MPPPPEPAPLGHREEVPMARDQTANAGAMRLDVRLHQRIATLDGMLRRTQAGALRDQVLAPMLQRLQLLARMVRRLEVDRTCSRLSGAVARDAEASCLGCANEAACRRWLESGVPDDAYRGFCENAERFDALSGRDS
jgi:hypothetical protein